MKLHIIRNDTSRQIIFFVPDSSSSTGAGLTGLVWNSAGLTAYYYREGAGSATAITLATKTLGTWASGGFVAVDATNMPGWYELGIPDAALVSGAKYVGIALKGATNMAPVNIEIQLTGANLDDSVRCGLTALPNAAADAAGGLPISDAGGLDLDAMNTNINDIETDTNELQTDWTNGGRLDLLLDAIPTTPMRGTDSAALASVCTEARLAELDAANLPTDIAAVKSDTAATLVDTGTTIPATLGSPAGASMSADIAAVKVDTAATLVDTGTTLPGLIGIPVADLAADLAAVAANVGSILADTNALQVDWADGGRLDLLIDQVVAEVVTAQGEPAQGAPPVSAPLADKIAYLYKAWRNKTTQTATTYKLYDDAGTTVDHKSTVSDDATTFTRGEIATGP